MSELTDDKPFVSIIIPAYNSEKIIRECLESLTMQKYPKDRFEIIVVDSGYDNTQKICLNYNTRYFHLPTRTYAGAARNIGFTYSKGEILAFTDSDCIIPENWLATIADDLRDYQSVQGVGGILSFQTRIHKKNKKAQVFYFAEANCAFRRSLFERGCRFGEGYAKHHEPIVDFLNKNGLKILLDPWLIVAHPDDPSDTSVPLKKRLGKRYRSGFGYGESLISSLNRRSSQTEILKTIFVVGSVPFLFLILLFPFNLLPFLYVNIVFAYSILRMRNRYFVKFILRDFHNSILIRWSYWTGIIAGIFYHLILRNSRISA